MVTGTMINLINHTSIIVLSQIITDFKKMELSIPRSLRPFRKKGLRIFVFVTSLSDSPRSLQCPKLLMVSKWLLVGGIPTPLVN